MTIRKGYLHPVLSGRVTLPASRFRQSAGYETAGQPAGRQGAEKQGQYGIQGLYPWGGYVFHGGKAASWEQSSFRFFYVPVILQGKCLSSVAADSWQPLFSRQYPPP